MKKLGFKIDEVHMAAQAYSIYKWGSMDQANEVRAFDFGFHGYLTFYFGF